MSSYDFRFCQNLMIKKLPMRRIKTMCQFL
jgi:hypothetical protein